MECEKCVCQRICDKTEKSCENFWGKVGSQSQNSKPLAQNTEVIDVLNLIEIALIKHFPKRPWICTDFSQNKTYHCSTCNSELDILYDLYCPKCGQKIEWNIE